MHRTPPGTYTTINTACERFQPFVPAPLPPTPSIVWSPALHRQFDDAHLALGRLDAINTHLPNAAFVLHSSMRMEAVHSSQIEGTRSSLADLLLYEIGEQPSVPADDAHEVSQCVAALDHGLTAQRSGLTLSLRLLSGMHEQLMSHPGGAAKTPGEFRRSQVWLGGSRPGNAAFVPPPAHALADCLSDLERFLNDIPNETSPLLKAALAHVQFETIHPFLDGNGRVGRLLIVLQLVADGVLQEPMLYPSLFFNTHRARYYECLNAVRLDGDWERWLMFFAEAVEVTAMHAVATAAELQALVNRDRDTIATLGRAAQSALAVHAALQQQPISTSGSLVRATGLTPATVNKSLTHLERSGVVTELTNQRRGRVFSYTRYVEQLETELTPNAC